MPLSLVANWEQVIWKRDSPITEIVEVMRNKNILSAKVGCDVARTVDAWTLNDISIGIVVDAVAKPFR